jgi:ribosomal protein S12 methylthiotransferase accessory factor
MRKLRRLKPYKACDPLETVERVRAILDGLGIEVVESHTDEPDLGLYSCRIQMVLPEGGRILPGIGSNGKGMTRAYSLASAYAEFMERVQNGFLLNNHASLERPAGRRGLSDPA